MGDLPEITTSKLTGRLQLRPTMLGPRVFVEVEYTSSPLDPYFSSRTQTQTRWEKASSKQMYELGVFSKNLPT